MVSDTLNPVKCFTVDNAKEPDLDALKNIQEMAVKKSNAEEKPWRKAGKWSLTCRYR